MRAGLQRYKRGGSERRSDAEERAQAQRLHHTLTSSRDGSGAGGSWVFGPDDTDMQHRLKRFLSWKQMPSSTATPTSILTISPSPKWPCPQSWKEGGAGAGAGGDTGTDIAVIDVALLLLVVRYGLRYGVVRYGLRKASGA